MATKDEFLFSAVDSDTVNLTVHNRIANKAEIHKGLFGNFLENLGASFHGGVLAEMLSNPMMAPEHNLPKDQLDLLTAHGRTIEQFHRLTDTEREAFKNWRPRKLSTGFGSYILDDETKHGIPLGWRVRPCGAGSGGQSGRIGPSLKLHASGNEVVVGQGVIPPIHRENCFEGHVWVRVNGVGTLRAQWRERTDSSSSAMGQVICEKELPWPAQKWQKIDFTLNLPKRAWPDFWVADFCISVTGDAEVWIDRILLLPADHVEGFDPDALAMIRRAAPTILRWPGGNFVSGYHFWHGIGPVDRRMTRPNEAWGGIDTNLMGTDEFVKLCRLIGAEPHICVNQGSGSAQEAAAWVEYVNGSPDTYWGKKRAENGCEEPYGVKIWEVGNEIYGPWQIGHCGSEENALRFREWSREMKAVDDTITVLATGSFFDFLDESLQWNAELLRRGGPHLDSIALHELPENHKGFPVSFTSADLFEALMAQVWRWEQVDIPNLVELIEGTRGMAKTDISVTEWGILGEPDRPEVGNYGGAVYAALFLHFALRHRDWIRYAHPNGLFHAGCIRRFGPVVYWDPQLEVVRRYSNYIGCDLYVVEEAGPSYDFDQGSATFGGVKGVPYVDVVAVRDVDGHIEVAAANRSAEREFVVKGSLQGFERSFQEAYVEMLWEDDLLAMNTPLAPNSIRIKSLDGIEVDNEGRFQIILKPASIVWIKLR